MNKVSPYENEIFLYSVHETLKNKVFEILKKPLMELAEKTIDEACKKAVSEMDVSLNMFRDREYMRDQINILYRGQNGS